MVSTRLIRENDIPYIASIHKAVFPKHFLGKFSVRLIQRFYECYYPKCIFIVHDSDDGIDGFVMGGESQVLKECQRRFIQDHFLLCAWEILSRPMLYPEVSKKIFNRLYRMGIYSSPENFRLLSIAVDKNTQGKGVAAQLVKAFEDAIHERVQSYGLSVHADNERAKRFYEKVGFQCEAAFDKHIYYVKKIQ